MVTDASEEVKWCTAVLLRWIFTCHLLSSTRWQDWLNLDRHCLRFEWIHILAKTVFPSFKHVLMELKLAEKVEKKSVNHLRIIVLFSYQVTFITFNSFLGSRIDHLFSPSLSSRLLKNSDANCKKCFFFFFLK